VSREVSFLVFFVIWARVQGWTVPLLHVHMCVWLEHCTDPVRVLMVFRGAAKSTIYAVYKAWKLYRNRTHRSLVWSADNPTATMLTADTINVLRLHPLCMGMLPTKPGAQKFWVHGARDRRNASMRANGVNSNATGARADDVDYDDIEVPGNIETIEARAKLRNRIAESTHILVPGGQETLIGTPHAHDSIYPERIAEGAACLKIPLFAHTKRFLDTSKRLSYPIPFDPDEDGLTVLLGIHKGARVLIQGVDFTYADRTLTFKEPPGAVLDICTGNAWPERFTRDEVGKRRKKTRTLNAWDSQYSLEAKPLTDVRLDPERMIAYDVQPRIVEANNSVALFLGKAPMVGVTAHWDPSSGKLKSDVSAFGVCYMDGDGRRYLHKIEKLKGEVAEFANDGKTIVGGQVLDICKLIKSCHLSRITIETNGIGGFAPAVLRAAITQSMLTCAVIEVHNTTNKNKRILEGFESLLLSRGMLWVHVSLLQRVNEETQQPEKASFYLQMRDWNPAVTELPLSLHPLNGSGRKAGFRLPLLGRIGATRPAPPSRQCSRADRNPSRRLPCPSFSPSQRPEKTYVSLSFRWRSRTCQSACVATRQIASSSPPRSRNRTSMIAGRAQPPGPVRPAACGSSRSSALKE
jgi:hypothetical protein